MPTLGGREGVFWLFGHSGIRWLSILAVHASLTRGSCICKPLSSLWDRLAHKISAVDRVIEIKRLAHIQLVIAVQAMVWISLVIASVLRSEKATNWVLARERYDVVVCVCVQEGIVPKSCRLYRHHGVIVLVSSCLLGILLQARSRHQIGSTHFSLQID